MDGAGRHECRPARGYVLETGEITRTDRGEVLLNDPKVQEAYLGE